ncbi:MAG: hypothetical protein WC812_00095 [Candidatus Pacearchaeota archaeon]|jgi:hypothetical protein
MMQTKDMTKDEIYKLMNFSDMIEEGMQINWPSEVYIALNENGIIIAAGKYQKHLPNSAYMKAVARGCLYPFIEKASKILTIEQINNHNKLLEKILSSKN